MYELAQEDGARYRLAHASTNGSVKPKVRLLLLFYSMPELSAYFRSRESALSIVAHPSQAFALEFDNMVAVGRSICSLRLGAY